MRLALLFSGQGGQLPSHLEYLRQQAAPLWREAMRALIPAELTDAPSLYANQIAQPLIFALQMDWWQQLREKLPRPLCVAGYSLGEMAACCVAGVFSPPQGVALCRERARLMDQASVIPSGLLAVRGLSLGEGEDLARQCGVELAIRNGVEHFVLGGTLVGLAAAEALALQRGADKVLRLEVGVASHTSMLAAASAGLAECLRPYANGALGCPVLSAIDGRIARTRGEAVSALARQVSMPFDWAACLLGVAEMQPERVLEIGPGNALAKMWGELGTGIPVRSTDDFRSSQGILRWVEGGG